MRIFCAIPYSGNSVALENSRTWYYNLYQPLRKLGCDLVSLDFDLDKFFANGANVEYSERYRPILSDIILKQIKVEHQGKGIDLFFSYLQDRMVEVDTIKQIRKMGIVTINYFCNNVHQFHNVQDISPHYDYCIVPEKQALQKYRRIGATPLHIQMAANPDVYKPYNLGKDYDATFIGQKYATRADYVYYLLKNGINIQVWGANWVKAHCSNLVGDSSEGSLANSIRILRMLKHPRYFVKKTYRKLVLEKYQDRYLSEIAHWPLPDNELVKMYSRSKISLSFAAVEDREEGRWKKHVRLRDFEAPMSGAFYLTEYVDELEEYYEIGKEIVCFTDSRDLHDKIKYYLKHDSEREMISKAGRERALSCHTWEVRFQKMFGLILGRKNEF